MADQAVRLVKGRHSSPLSMSCIDVRVLGEFREGADLAGFILMELRCGWRSLMADPNTCLTEA